MKKRTSSRSLRSESLRTDDAKRQGQTEQVVGEHTRTGADAHAVGEPVLESFLRSVLEIPNQIHFSTSGDIHAGCLKALVCNLAPNDHRTAFEKDSETLLRAWDELPPHIATEEENVRAIVHGIERALDKAAKPAGRGKWLAFRTSIYSFTDYRPERLPAFAARLPRKQRPFFRRLAKLYDEWLHLCVGRIFKVEAIPPSASALAMALDEAKGPDTIANRQERLDSFAAELHELIPALSPIFTGLVEQQGCPEKREQQSTRHFYFEVMGAMKAQEACIRDFYDRLPEECRPEFTMLTSRAYELGRAVAVALATAHAAKAETRYKAENTRRHKAAALLQTACERGLAAERKAIAQGCTKNDAKTARREEMQKTYAQAGKTLHRNKASQYFSRWLKRQGQELPLSSGNS